MKAEYFSQIRKFNPYHGRDGRFTTASGNRTGKPSIGSAAASSGNLTDSNFDDGTKIGSNVQHPEKVAGIKRGTPMPFADADGKRANPGREDNPQRMDNCQTCVIAYELRRRGYDVEAKPRTHQNYDQEKLSQDPTWAWRLPGTKNMPKVTNSAETYESSDKAYEYLQDTIEAGKRYTMNFVWGDGRGAHIIIAEKTDGKTWLFDPQSGDAIRTESGVKEYISRFAGVGNNPKQSNWQGGAIQTLPISDMDINPINVETILQKATT